jgi:hypothetical protein
MSGVSGQVVRRSWGAVAAGVMVVTIAACVGSTAEPVATSESPTPTSSTPTPSVSTPTPTATGIAEGASPLSGRPDGAGKPVLAVKVDNTSAAQPHAGLQAADLVYVEEVEWGLTRLIAVYSSQMPDVVGPVRSARISDIDILAALGPIAFAHSGAQSKLLPKLASATLLDASATASYAGWFDDADRPSPVDHMLRPADVLGVFDEAAVAQPIGLEFAATPPAGGQPVAEIEAQWGDSKIAFRWDETAGDYVVIIDGVESRSSEGGPQRAATVVIQSVEQTDSGYGDKYGGVTPFIETVGSGSAVVLRDGRLWSVTWERPSLDEGTRFLLPDGSVMPFAIGQQWIVLLDEERSAIVR